MNDGDCCVFGLCYLIVCVMFGYMSGCISFVFDDELMVFIGDCLLICGIGCIDF